MCDAIALRKKRTLHPDHTEANLVGPVTTWVFSSAWLQGSRKGTESRLELVFKCSPFHSSAGSQWDGEGEKVVVCDCHSVVSNHDTSNPI